MSEETILREAIFTPKVQAYWMLGGTILCIVTVIGLPVLPIWLLLGATLTSRYRKSLKAVLTERSLKVNKGVLVRVEKTIPLEKITDMGMVQGPIMRAFDLHTLTVETAGASGQGALVNLIGVVDAMGFRDAVLTQRDKIAGTEKAQPVPADTPNDQSVLLEIRDSLKRIEGYLRRE